MRIVIDMQAAESGSRFRGMGRYVTALARAMAQQRGEHELILAVNGAFADAVDAIRAEFAEWLPAEAVRVWMPPQPCCVLEEANDNRRHAAEAMYEAFLTSLQPDAILLGSLFECLVDDTVTSIGVLEKRVPVAVVLYDLIPLIHSRVYLSNPALSRWYHQKLDHLRRADRLLAISASSGREAVDYLGFDPEQVVVINTACDEWFRPVTLSRQRRKAIARKFGLNKPFVMYNAGIDHRKNLEGLIRAYARLPQGLRRDYQLALVCNASKADIARFSALAQDHGLHDGEWVMTGFVSDEDLLALHNACALFVFPSWHEGFGLPALEAMACGRPTIGANTSSLPEVIGRADALFDPFDDADIAKLMHKVLTKPGFRRDLERHARKQAARFSWAETARRTWAALNDLVAQAKSSAVLPVVPTQRSGRRPRLAYVSPIRSAKSGIADYSAELLPELARYYEIDLIIQQEEPVHDTWALGRPIHNPSWFRAHRHHYDRVLYQVGNSTYHSHILDLLEEIPGAVALHDFFISGIARHREFTGERPGYWFNALYHSHGWPALIQGAKGGDDAVWRYPCNLAVLQQALGLVVHSQYAGKLAAPFYGAAAAEGYSCIPLLRTPITWQDEAERARMRSAARRALGVAEQDFVVCSFGHLGSTKLNDRLLAAWQAWRKDDRCQLIFVGQNEGGEYGQALARELKRPQSGRARITGFVDAETYRLWLMAADMAVQLRCRSRGETSASALDCWNAALATVVNANGAMAELDDSAVLKLPDEFADEDLVRALDRLYHDADLRKKLGQAARQQVLARHHPRDCAHDYAMAIEAIYAKAQTGPWGVVRSLQQAEHPVSVEDQIKIAEALSASFPPSPRPVQWLLDCSTLVQVDAKTSVQRVVRALLLEWLQHAPAGVRIEPVYATPAVPGYRYARRFTAGLLGIPDGWCQDEPVEAWAGDTFFALDLQHGVLQAQASWLQGLRTRGVKVWTMVYDLLPLLLPSAFAEGMHRLHQHWLEALTGFDGALAISRAVADELLIWLDAYGDKTRRRPFAVSWFHLGADIEQSAPTRGIPAEGAALLDRCLHGPVFLMVGTVEPRKGHVPVLESFERLWARGVDAALVIVGKQGWSVETLAERLRRHAEAGKRLYWLEGISDECLDVLYASSACMIAASEGEGFGLPLIEAARHGLPLLLRDIPVFREVAGKHAAYFAQDADAAQLALAIEQWLAAYASQSHPASKGLPWLTWAQSAGKAASILAGQTEPYRRWMPDPEKMVYWGNDLRLMTQVGRRRGYAMESTGQAGYLLYGPYRAFDAGHWRITLHGTARHWCGAEKLDVAYNGGKAIVHEKSCVAQTGEWSASAVIVLDEHVDDLEFRLWVGTATDIAVDRITIESNTEREDS